MIKVTDVVLDIIERDEVAEEALRSNLLNLSSYAQKIHPLVENATKKPVKKGTIVVALSRLTKNLSKKASLMPEVKLTNLSITSSLAIFSYKKTPDLQRKLSVLHPFTSTVQDLFSVTEGPSEITIVCSEKAQDQLVKHLGSKPKSEYNDVVAITCGIDEKNINIPNIYHVLFSAVAYKRINIFEIVSTNSEIVFLVKREDMEQTLAILNTFFRREKQ